MAQPLIDDSQIDVATVANNSTFISTLYNNSAFVNGVADNTTFINNLATDTTLLTVFASGGGFSSGQTWQSPSRSANTVYTNNTGNPIYVAIACAGGQSGTFRVNGSTMTRLQSDAAFPSRYWAATAIIPDGDNYEFTGFASVWRELR